MKPTAAPGYSTILFRVANRDCGGSVFRMLITFTPGGKMEEFFRAIAVPNGPALDAAVLARHEMQHVGPGLVA